ncbi:hypothetical protein [Roseibacillus ishigakijimensis]|uniref:Uncharacterized protein n=1 Tax=Roseibacillus ishigakijimensis TaxID=454146 RepID=A0A934RMP7_9BACT|nr:hypothetical protein [Roseibacillus ishigakijimensis]MBK1834224.1 hypothetical protein [Roseibacillus ishigakijimensis]
MRIPSFILAFSLLGICPAFSQEGRLEDADILEKRIERQPVPADILAAAVQAVQELGDLTLRGEYAEVVNKTYPRYLKRAAKKAGGNDRIAAEMERAVDEFAASGLTITKFTAEPAVSGFDIPEFNEWLVFVPTKRQVRRIDPATGVKEFIELTDYQVAIRGKEEGASWGFINGSTLEVQELRGFFPSLPSDIADFAIPEKGFRRVN